MKWLSPAEVISHAGMNLYMGVNAENNVVIPTIWTDFGMIRSAAAPSGDASSDPSLPVWAQIRTDGWWPFPDWVSHYRGGS